MNRSGFTLPELLVSLVLCGVGVSIAASLFAASLDAVVSMNGRADRAEAEANGQAWLRETLLAAAGPADGGYFMGGPDTLKFRSSVWVPLGWTEPGDVLVTFSSGRVGTTTRHGAVVLPDSLNGAVLEYLGGYGADSPWLRSWASAALPLAVRLRRSMANGAGDTLVFLVGLGR